MAAGRPRGSHSRFWPKIGRKKPEKEAIMKEQTVVSHMASDGSDFHTGLRPYFTYRDTGVKDVTNGAFTAHVIRAVPGQIPKPEWHTHTVGFQLFYVLKGW